MDRQPQLRSKSRTRLLSLRERSLVSALCLRPHGAPLRETHGAEGRGPFVWGHSPHLAAFSAGKHRLQGPEPLLGGRPRFTRQRVSLLVRGNTMPRRRPKRICLPHLHGAGTRCKRLQPAGCDHFQNCCVYRTKKNRSIGNSGSTDEDDDVPPLALKPELAS